MHWSLSWSFADNIICNININTGICIAHLYNQTEGALQSHGNMCYSELYA